jgi:hypothetical protein
LKLEKKKNNNNDKIKKGLCAISNRIKTRLSVLQKKTPEVIK